MNREFLVLLPVILPLGGAALGMLTRRRPRWQLALSVAAILSAVASSAALLATLWSAEEALVYRLGGWLPPAGIVLVGDPLAAFMVFMSHLVMAAGILYAVGCQDKCARYPTFYPLFLTLATGLSGALLTGDLFNLYVFTEVMVISGAVLTAISDDRYGVEASYKYFYISLLASVFLLMACGALYVSYGTLNLADLAQRIAAAPDRPLTNLALVLLLAFFMVKSAVVPFHFWQPDFHAAAPTAVSAMLSSVVVKFGVYGFLRLTTLLFVPQAESVRSLLILLGCLGAYIGGLSAAGTHNAKRMLAYSTLAQIGLILVAIGWNTPLSMATALVFTFNHSLVKSAMLMLAGAIASRAHPKSAAYRVVIGVGKASPAIGVTFLLGGMALAGLPPMNGFISKMMIFQSGLEAGAFLPLAALGLAGLISLVYVTRAFMIIWWQAPAEEVPIKPQGDRVIVPALLVSACLLLGLWAEPLIGLAMRIVQWLDTPMHYITAVLGG